jgi:hypothetical protein
MWHLVSDESKPCSGGWSNIRTLTFAHPDGRTASGSYWYGDTKRLPSLTIYKNGNHDDGMTWDDDWVDEKDMLEILNSKFAE